jgi:hypothetical protein
MLCEYSTQLSECPVLTYQKKLSECPVTMQTIFFVLMVPISKVFPSQIEENLT